jgi:hypothetical protein
LNTPKCSDLGSRLEKKPGLRRQDPQPKKDTADSGEKKNAHDCVPEQQIYAFLIWRKFSHAKITAGGDVWFGFPPKLSRSLLLTDHKRQTLQVSRESVSFTDVKPE